MGFFRVSKNQKSGKYHELPRKSTQKNVGVEVLGGKQIKSPGNFMNCRENRDIFLTPLRGWRREGRPGGRGQGGRKGEREREAGREGGARAKPDNQLV